MIIRCKDDYKYLLEKIKKEANEANNAYEFVGMSCRFAGATDVLKDMFDISDEFEREFLEAIATFNRKVIGPYNMEKYFLLIPELRKAMRQLIDDCDETRRAIIQFPPDHCFQSIQFLLRENTVHVVCYMRSCDAFNNLPHDMWLCSKMADIYASNIKELLGIHPYEFHSVTMMFGSLHILKKDIANVL